MTNKEQIEFRLDESNELVFTVQVEAPEPTQPKYRFICEASGISYMFDCSVKDGSVNVIVPPMKSLIGEGVYDARLEVIVSDKYFVPIELDAKFVQPVGVQVESVSVKASRKAEQLTTEKVEKQVTETVKVTANPKVRVKKTTRPTPNKQAPNRHLTLREQYEKKRNA